MAAYLSQNHIPNREFILKRCGIEARNIINRGRYRQQQFQNALKRKHNPKQLLSRVYHFFHHRSHWREWLLKVLCGREYRMLQIGRFRQKGENHRWMYDRYSLSVLLSKCGLKSIKQRTAAESYIPNWTSFNLDTEPDGTVYKPDSLYMEGVKP